jgi:hypothetical protein
LIARRNEAVLTWILRAVGPYVAHAVCTWLVTSMIAVGSEARLLEDAHALVIN